MNPIADLKGYCDSIGLKPRTLVEVGAAHPDTYRLSQYVNTDSWIVLVEANPRLFYCLAHGYNGDNWVKEWPSLPHPPYDFQGLGRFPNVNLLHAAITERPGLVRLFERNASSFVEGLQSPAKANDGYLEDVKDSYTVPGITIDQIDDGTIDVLLADCEGSEWFCLKGLKSRPKVIVLELSGRAYTNPYSNEILAWMTENGYDVGGHVEQDSWFVRRDVA